MRHIPNILSVIRILLIPFFVQQYLAGNTAVAAILLAVSGLTDLLDGFLARRFGWVSQVGKVLDPVADKLTQVTVCILLIISMRQYWPMFAVLLLKETVMLVLGGYLLKKGVKLEGARWFGKVTTTLFYVTCVLIIFFPAMPDWLEWGLLGLTVVSALVSAALYLPEYIRYRRIAAEQADGPAAGADTTKE